MLGLMSRMEMDNMRLAEPAAIGKDSSAVLAGEEATGGHICTEAFQAKLRFHGATALF